MGTSERCHPDNTERRELGAIGGQVLKFFKLLGDISQNERFGKRVLTKLLGARIEIDQDVR